jgi:hypothetical protein
MEGKREKTGGRVAGTPNKRTIEALEVFELMEFCPLESVLKKLKEMNMDDELFISTCLKLMDYKFPRRKAIEHVSNLSSASTEELIAEAKMLISSHEKGSIYE